MTGPFPEHYKLVRQSLPVWVISKDLLVRNKLATGRPQDLADAKRLG
jgi:hypothetical protein